MSDQSLQHMQDMQDMPTGKVLLHGISPLHDFPLEVLAMTADPGLDEVTVEIRVVWPSGIRLYTFVCWLMDTHAVASARVTGVGTCFIPYGGQLQEVAFSLEDASISTVSLTEERIVFSVAESDFSCPAMQATWR